MLNLTCKFIKPLLIVFGIFLLLTPFSAKPALADQTAVIATAEPGYQGSGAISVIAVDPPGGPRTFANSVDVFQHNDITVFSHGSYFYVIGRYNLNSITKYAIQSPDKPIWNYSTEGTEQNSNPQDLIFLNDTKAYLTRLGSAKVWIVKPTTTNENDFKTGEIDLSAYVDSDIGDGLPKAHSGVIVAGKLFIALQEYDIVSNSVQYYPAKIVVIDTSTDNVMGVISIPEPMRDPYGMQYIAAVNTIYVQCSGNTWVSGNETASGIVAINPTDAIDNLKPDEPYSPSPAIITGDASSHGFISGMAIISATKGYFVGYAGWGNNTLYSFNPSTGTVIQAIPGLENINIAGFECGVTLDKYNMLWICNLTAMEMDILNTTTDEIDEKISTSQAPQKVAFVDGAPTNLAAFKSSGGGGGGCFISAINR